MRSGQLRHLVSIETPPTTLGDRGQRTGDWVELYHHVPASVVTLSGLELIRAHKIHPEATTEIRIRYHAGIESKQRVVWGSHTYNILHVNNVQERNIELILTAVEVR